MQKEFAARGCCKRFCEEIIILRFKCFRFRQRVYWKRSSIVKEMVVVEMFVEKLVFF